MIRRGNRSRGQTDSPEQSEQTARYCLTSIVPAAIMFFLLGVGVAVLAGTLGASIESPASVTHASEPKAQLILPKLASNNPVHNRVEPESDEVINGSAGGPRVKQAVSLGQHYLAEATQVAVSQLAGALHRSLLLKAQSASSGRTQEPSNREPHSAVPQRANSDAQCVEAYKDCTLMCPDGGGIDAGFDLGFEDDAEVCEAACNDGRKVCLGSSPERACGDFLGACRYRCMTEGTLSGDCEDACELAEASCRKLFHSQKTKN